MCRLQTWGGGKIILPANKAVVTDAQGNLSTGDVTAEEVGFLKGLTGNAQEQFNSISDISTVTINQFFKDIVDGTDFRTFFANRKGDKISIYALASANAGVIATVNEEYVPLGFYNISFALNASSPYLPISTLWINGSGNLTLYSNGENGKMTFYFYSEYTIKT